MIPPSARVGASPDSALQKNGRCGKSGKSGRSGKNGKLGKSAKMRDKRRGRHTLEDVCCISYAVCRMKNAPKQLAPMLSEQAREPEAADEAKTQ
jgi:hypothetical protein